MGIYIEIRNVWIETGNWNAFSGEIECRKFFFVKVYVQIFGYDTVVTVYKCMVFSQ